MKFGTKAIHAGVEPDPATGAIMTPIYQTSTYVQEAPGVHKGYEYSRTQNPTRHALEKAYAELEGAAYGACFSSGMAATDTILKLLKPGDEVISTNDLYGGSYRIMTKVFANYGVVFHFIDLTKIENLEKLLTPKTRMIWIETPTNPLLNIIDIEAVTKIARPKGILTVVDNTFATPYLQSPMALGADIVVHSATKYLGGHSDLVMGCAVTSDAELNERIRFIQNSCGATPGPQDSFLALRGMKTLHVRMDRHCDNAEKVAAYLNQHPKVARVYYPGLESHNGHSVAKKQMKRFGGMVSFYTKNDSIEEALVVLKNTRLFSLAESLGGVESLIGHPATMTHASIPEAERLKAGLNNSLIRLSVGIEDVDDLLEDIENALRAI